LQPERDLGRSPLFQVKLILQNAPREGLELGGIRLSGGGGEVETASEAQTARFDLTVALTNERHGLVGAVNYSLDLFEKETIERLMNHYTNVLRGIVECDRPICEISLLSDQERKQIVVEWNETGRPYPKKQRIQDLFSEQVERAPDQIALIGEQAQVSYRELNRRANQLGRYLQGIGVGPEVVVGLCLGRSVEMVIAVMGVLKAGGAYSPLDPESPLERLSYILEDAGVGVVLTDQELENRLPAFWGQTVCLDVEWKRISDESEREPGNEVGADDLAYVIYTSGSTGGPKGVAVHQQALVARTVALVEAYGLTSADRLLQFVSPSFDAFAEEVFTTLSRGASLVIDKRVVSYSANDLLDIVERLAITTLHIPPAYWHQLVDDLSASRRRVSSQLRLFITGGESPSRETLKKWAVLTEQQSSFVNAYGPTEATITSTVYRIQMNSSQISLQTRVPIGQPIANTQVYILDLNCEVAPIGMKGELYIGGAGVARGYLRRAEISAEKFVPHPFSEEAGARLYRTGDVGRYLEDGNIEFLGRVDEQVKVRGYRIELGEIEAALDAHRWVRQRVVVASEGERGVKRLIGYVVGEAGATAAELKRHLREKLPEYMVPEVIVILEEMPITANGKIDIKKLPLVKDGGRQVEREYVVARTPVEEMLVGIFEELLKLDRVGIHDNFFEIGGHSLLATQVITRVRNAFGSEIGVGSIFEEPTVKGLARRIEDAMMAGEKQEALPLAPASRDGQRVVRLPLSFAQQRLWFLDQLTPNNSIYNITVAVRLEGRLNIEILESAINEVVRRHEVLRTRIEVEAGEPAQVVEEWEYRMLEVEDLTSLTLEEREEEAGRISTAMARIGFDLSRGPLLRVKALKLEEERHVLLYSLHQIVSDAWSAGLLAREICKLYEAMSEGQASPLPELEIQYADYADWQRRSLGNGALEVRLQYWKKQLGGKLPVMNLAVDRPRPLVPSYHGATTSILLPAELCESLKALSKREGVTLFTALLTAFKTLLYRYTAESDIAVVAAMANRDRAEVEDLIGFFVSMLPMRTDFSGNPRFTVLLKRVKDVALSAYIHQEAPFEKLADEIGPERALGQSPLFNIAFGMQNAPAEEMRVRGLRIGPVVAQEPARFDLMLRITKDAETMQAGWIYSADLFEEETINRMHSHFETLLYSIVARPDAPLDELEMLSEAEKAQQSINRIIRKEYNYSRFKSVKPKAVTLSED